MDDKRTGSCGEMQVSQRIIRLRVINVLKKWIEVHYNYDFADNIGMLTNFVATADKFVFFGMEQMAKALKDLLERKRYVERASRTRALRLAYTTRHLGARLKTWRRPKTRRPRCAELISSPGHRRPLLIGSSGRPNCQHWKSRTF